MITAAEEWMQEGFVKGEIIGQRRGTIQGQIEAKISMIENFLRTNITWETITQATRIDQNLFQFMKDIYSGIFIDAKPETAQIETEVEEASEYIKDRQAMVVKILHYRFQLSDVQQAEMLEYLASVQDKEQLSTLIDNALIVENLNLFYAELFDFIDPASSVSAVG